MHTHAIRPTPWYRQRWPWLLIAGPAIVVVAGIVTVWLAIRSDDGLVADDYYRQGLAINQVIGRTDRAKALGISATVTVDADGHVAAHIAAPGNAAEANPEEVALLFAHPTRAGGDVRVALRRTADGSYAGHAALPATGRWRVILEAPTWRLPAAELGDLPAKVSLQAGAR